MALNYKEEEDEEREDLTLNECKSVKITDGKSKCCLLTAKYEKKTISQCYPLLQDKIDDFLKLSEESLKNNKEDEEENGAFQKVEVDCGDGNEDGSSASNYLSKALIILLYILF